MKTYVLSARFYSIAFAVLIVANGCIYGMLFASHATTAEVFTSNKSVAVLLCGPSGETALIDTGGDASILRVLGEALPPWQRNINTVILTATKSDTAGGLPSVTERYRVSTLARFGANGSSAQEAAVATAARAIPNVFSSRLPYGAALSFGNAHITVIAPDLVRISSTNTSLVISSSTPPGTYPF